MCRVLGHERVEIPYFFPFAHFLTTMKFGINTQVYQPYRYHVDVERTTANPRLVE